MRESLLSTLHEDKEHLRASNAVQLEKLRLQLDTQIQKSQLVHSRKVRDESRTRWLTQVKSVGRCGKNLV